MDCAETPGKERYRLLGKSSASLGRGSYGNVRAAWDRQTQKLVAIKIQDRKSDEGARELMLFQCLPEHPNLLRLHDMFVSGGEMSMVFDYCLLSLADVWRRAQGFLDWEKTFLYGEQILRGLGHLHQNGVAHRDLSLSNVLIKDDRCVVADLGLAECASTMVLDRVVTTAWYRAPEACFPGAQKSTQQCPLDMWSYGVVIAELWTATRIFATEKGDDVKALLRMLVDWLGAPPDEYPYLEELEKRMPRQVEAAKSGCSMQGRLRERLVSSSFVRRSMQNSPEVMDLIAALLCWNPTDRATAESGLKVWKRLNPERARSGTPSVLSTTLSQGSGGDSSEKQTPERTTMDSSGAEAVSGSAPGTCATAQGEAVSQSPQTTTSQDSAQKNCADMQIAEMCKCSGNCGNRSCMRKKRRLKSGSDSEQAKRRRAGQICDMIPCAPGQFCRNCTCTQEGCSKPRAMLQHLCLKHATQASNLKRKLYMSPRGPLQMDEAWSEEVKLIATHGWMLKDMCPCDIEACTAALDKLIGGKAKLSGYDLLNGYVVAVLKLPDVVLEWVGLTLAGTETEAEAVSRSASRSKLRTAADYMNATIKLARIVDSIDTDWQCQQLLGGTQQLIFGLTTLLRKLDMMSDTKDGAASIAPKLQHRDDQWAELIKIAKDFDDRYPEGLSLPKTVEETLLFAKRVAEFLVKFPKKFGLGTLVGEGKNSGYVRKHIVRKFVEWARGHTPSDLWDAWTLEQVLEVTPDKMNLLQGVPRTWDGQQIKQKFAVSSFMLSCWACLFHGVDSKNRAALAKPSVKLQQLFLEKKEENRGCEPRLGLLARLFASF